MAQEFVCTVCGYVYDSGEEEKSGLSFDELPEEWECPVCGADKSKFKLVE